MSEPPSTGSPISLLALGTIRRYIRRSHAVMMTAFFAIVYALASMTLGSMLILTHLTPPYYGEVVWTGGAPSWNYPGLLIVQPWGVLTLPFFPTLAMVLVSIGVGIGMSVAVLLAVALVRGRRRQAGQPAAVGSIAGLTPAMIALVTLGACCSTTAAATAGVGIVGQVSGSSTSNLLLNNWFLGVFQIAVVWIALLAQEMILRVYGGLFGLPEPSRGPAGSSALPPRASRRTVASAMLRGTLLVGGITWSLSMFTEWTVTSPGSAGAAQWFAWIVEHQALAIFAIVAALFPRSTAHALARGGNRAAALGLRAVLLVGGLALAVGVPPPLSSTGAAGLGNQLVAVLAGASAFGASSPPLAGGAGLYFSWAVQMGALGVFAVLSAVAPGRATTPLIWSAADSRGGSMRQLPSLAFPQNGSEPSRDVSGAALAAPGSDQAT